jgi:hypothetical protein
MRVTYDRLWRHARVAAVLGLAGVIVLAGLLAAPPALRAPGR